MKNLTLARSVAGIGLIATVALAGSVVISPSVTGAPTEAARLVLPTVPADGQFGFVVATFSPAIVPGMADNCPSGFNLTTEKNYLAMQPADERARLVRPENAKELEQRWKALGSNATNVCSNYDQFPERPLNRLVQSPAAQGLDLDRAAKGETCGHDEFTSPAGEAGIDNQAYRALGCSSSWRGPDGEPGEIAQVYKNYLTRGEYKIVVLVRGVQSLERDNDVEVVLATTDDMPVLDSMQEFVPGATFRITANPRWRNVFRGRIDNGVLTTGPANVVLSRPISTGGPRAKRAEWDFANARLKLEFRPDGSVKGLLGGYQPLFSLIHLQVNAGVGSAFTVNLDCAADYNTLKKLADGGRDPKTGQCTRISSAWEVRGVPAFIVDSSRQIANRR